jgi:hypothetical protein
LDQLKHLEGRDEVEVNGNDLQVRHDNEVLEEEVHEEGHPKRDRKALSDEEGLWKH